LDALNPRIAQPALNHRSFYSYDITLRRPGCAARWTNFVETMCPTFRRDVLLINIEQMAQASYGWGLDYVWQRQARRQTKALAIIDATPVLHTRAIRTSALYARKHGEDPAHELERVAPKALREIPCAYEAVDEYGKKIPYLALNRRLILPRYLHKYRKRRR